MSAAASKAPGSELPEALLAVDTIPENLCSYKLSYVPIVMLGMDVSMVCRQQDCSARNGVSAS